ncbi:MAG: hypothetical protein IJA20_02620 [Methanocorpusculum sp.]|nr:hypothetical protein [Methanocorpusculum sp.]
MTEGKDDTSPTSPKEAAKRVADECEGWMKYKKLSAYNAEKYNIPAKQEFGHMLLALSDLFSRIRKENLTPDEKGELKKLVEHVHKETTTM